MTNRGEPIVVYLPITSGHHPSLDRVALREKYSEGYPTGDYTITGLTKESLQELADWMIQLPAELYAYVEPWSRSLERLLVQKGTR